MYVYIYIYLIICTYVYIYITYYILCFIYIGVRPLFVSGNLWVISGSFLGHFWQVEPSPESWSSSSEDPCRSAPAVMAMAIGYKWLENW